MFIIPFTSPEATLANAGGKGVNLARLTQADFNVPDGFIISTNVYRNYVSSNNLDGIILTSLYGIDSESSPEQLEAASAQIRTAFETGKLHENIQSQIRDAYIALDNEQLPPVAVRSSATAEDLPDLSFAGQQDTYLNITDEAQLLKAVVNCWSSLWTARAIGYRARNNIAHEEASLAVIVQKMIMSDVSGVLFTANPLTGLRSESVIDATLGLGEALVSGQITPDHFVVDCVSGAIKEMYLGSKETSTRSKPGGGVENVTENAGTQQTLSEPQLRQLTSVGRDIQKEYGLPQDIEWAFADGNLHILQSRAITSLFPIPQIKERTESGEALPLQIWFSFAAVQGVMGPISPLGRNAIRSTLLAGAYQLFDMHPDPEDVDIFVEAGERLWVKIGDLIRHPTGNHAFNFFLGYIEPSVIQILKPLSTEPALGAGKGKFKFSTLRRLAYFGIPIIRRTAYNMIHPDKARAQFDSDIERTLDTAHIPSVEDRFEGLANVTAFMRNRLTNAFPFLLPRFIPLLGPSMAALNFLRNFSPEIALEVTRGLPNNVTTEMDLALWETAKAIKSDKESEADFRDSDAPDLAHRYMENKLPDVSQTAIARFMEKYGMRGVGEIDFGQPRWREAPEPVMHTLKSYMQITPELAPDVLFAKGEQAAQAAIEQLAEISRKQHGGWFKEKLVRAMAKRLRVLMGTRESPKFFAIRTMGIARKAMLEVGQKFAEAGTINSADDLVFLTLDELEDLAHSSRNTPAENLKHIIAERRANYVRETRRTQVPRVLVSDGRAFYEGIDAGTQSGDTINGSPVSPGVVEGNVHVVLDPRGAQLAPGEILVCPGTDPAWTPLFMTAGGLVTEVGGMMTHGSVVAREYGIPAIVGVHQATTRLKDGQRVRVDGATGKISIVKAESA